MKNIDRRLITILLIVFVQLVGSSMLWPILPLYAQHDFEMSPEMISLLMASFFVAQFIAGPFLGRLSDKYGRLPVLIISQIGTAISFAGLGLAQSVWMLFAARIFDGITGGNIIVAQAYITDITPEKERTTALGLIFAAFGVGFTVGPAIGGGLSALFGSQIPFLIAAVIALLVVVLTWFTLDESLSYEQRMANKEADATSLQPAMIIKNTPLTLVLIIVFITQFVMGVVQSTFALYGEAILFTGYTPDMVGLGIGLLLTIVGISQLLTQTMLLKRALKRFGEAQLVIFGTLIRALSMFLFAVVVSPWLATIPGILIAIGTGLMMPALQTIATRTVADELRGAVLGVYQSSYSLAIIFGNALGGVMFAVTPTAPYWGGAILGILCTIPAVILWRQLDWSDMASSTV